MLLTTGMSKKDEGPFFYLDGSENKRMGLYKSN